MSKYIDLSGGAKRHLSQAIQFRVEAVATDLVNEIKQQMEGAAPRTGREYPMPDRVHQELYTASAPGEPPAVRIGEYLASWQVTPAVVRDNRIVAFATSDRKTEDGEHFVGAILEHGAPKANILPRPHIGPALEVVAQRWGGVVREMDE